MAVNYNDESPQQFGGGETPAEASYTEAPDIPEQYLNDGESVADSQETSEINEESDGDYSTRKQSRKYESIKDRLSQVQREKFQYLNALTELQKENEQLKTRTELSEQSAMYQYEEGVAERLEHARELKLQALEAGDIQAQVDADLQLNLATADAVGLNNWKAQQSLLEQQNQVSSQHDEEAYNAVRLNEAANWASQNSWFHPKSEDYDEWTANQVHAYCNEFDNNLYRNGLDALMYTPEYFQVINGHIDALKNNNRSNRRELSMRPYRGAVSAVRNNYGGQSEYGAQPSYQKLSPSEREVARMLKIDERTYLKHRMKEQKESPHRRGRYGQ